MHIEQIVSNLSFCCSRGAKWTEDT